MTDPASIAMTDLLPCPVCGEQPKWRGSAHDYRAGIFRLQCIGETHLFQSYGATDTKAIAAWNTRAAITALRKQAEPVAWMRLWAFNNEEPPAGNPKYWNSYRASQDRIFPDDIALYASPTSTRIAGIEEAANVCDAIPHYIAETCAAAIRNLGAGTVRYEKPFAYCCAEAGGDVAGCDCVNKDHGTAYFDAVCSIPNCRNLATKESGQRAAAVQPFHIGRNP